MSKEGYNGVLLVDNLPGMDAPRRFSCAAEMVEVIGTPIPANCDAFVVAQNFFKESDSPVYLIDREAFVSLMEKHITDETMWHWSAPTVLGMPKDEYSRKVFHLWERLHKAKLVDVAVPRIHLPVPEEFR